MEKPVAQRVAEERLDHRTGEPLEVEAVGSSRARSESGTPSIHSSVSTSRAVRSQSTAGTRKSGSFLVFSAISESAAASNRRSISSATERPQRVYHFDQPQPPRFGGHQLGLARGKGEGVEVELETPLYAWSEHLHRDCARSSAVAISARCTCAMEAAATGRTEDANARAAVCRVRSQSCHRPAAGMAASCPAGFRGRAPGLPRPRRAASPEIGRASHNLDQAGSEQRASRFGRACSPVARSVAPSRSPRALTAATCCLDQCQHALAREHETPARQTDKGG